MENKNNVYLVNAFSAGMIVDILNDGDVTVVFKKINDIEDVKMLLKSGFISVVGHETTAKLLGRMLDVDVPVNRISVKLKKGDIVVIFQLNQRLPEGVVLDEELLKNIDFTFILGTVDNVVQ